MRGVQNEQKTFGEVDISKRVFDSKSRDDMPRVLKGLQYIYTTIPRRYAIFQLQESRIAPEVNKFIGRPGMSLWTIPVCSMIRLDLTCDYEHLLKRVNQHNPLRAMLGHSAFYGVRYHFRTLTRCGNRKRRARNAKQTTQSAIRRTNRRRSKRLQPPFYGSVFRGLRHLCPQNGKLHLDAPENDVRVCATREF